MQITPIKTHKITPKDNIFEIIDRYVIQKTQNIRNSENQKSRKSEHLTYRHSDAPSFPSVLKDKSVVVITSKIISISQGRIVKIGSVDKDELIRRESQYFLPRNLSRFNVSFTIARDMLVPTAGIDESNGDGYYILWPENIQETVNKIRKYLHDKLKLKNIGVIISDSRTVPLRWGVTAYSIAYSGFKPLKDYVGKPDLFGRDFVFEKLNIADSLAAAAGIVMGEGSEQTPIAIINDIPNMEFVDHNPTGEELESLKISMDEDLYSPFLKNAKWEKGQRF